MFSKRHGQERVVGSIEGFAFLEGDKEGLELSLDKIVLLRVRRVG